MGRGYVIEGGNCPYLVAWRGDRGGDRGTVQYRVAFEDRRAGLAGAGIEAEGVRREEERDIGLFKGAMLLPWSLAW